MVAADFAPCRLGTRPGRVPEDPISEFPRPLLAAFTLWSAPPFRLRVRWLPGPRRGRRIRLGVASASGRPRRANQGAIVTLLKYSIWTLSLKVSIDSLAPTVRFETSCVTTSL